MKKLYLPVLLYSIMAISCQKETSCEGCRTENKPPVANAGPDQAVTLPMASLLLDGTGSKDPDGSIVEWHWKLLSGPSAPGIVNEFLSSTAVYFQTKGTYLFELTVKDNAGITAKDTVQVTVSPSQPTPSPQEQSGNLFLYFPDPTLSLDSVKIVTISTPPLTYVRVKIDNFPEGHIDGMWCNACAPGCPISADVYALPENITSFTLPPGTYTWTAETVFQNFNGYPFVGLTPFPKSLIYFFAMPHKTGGTVTILPNDTCVILKIVF